MRTVNTTVATAAALVMLASPAAAQAPGLEVKLNPRIGLYEPLTKLTDAPNAVTEMKGSLAVGLGLELRFGASPFGIRANMDYATSSSVETSSGGVTLGDSPDATLLAVVGDVVLRPLPRLPVVKPYLFAGGGLKQYDVTASSVTYESFKNESDLTVHLGGGLDLGLGPFALNAEVGDYVSWSDFRSTAGETDKKTQHDLFVTIGLAIGML